MFSKVLMALKALILPLATNTGGFLFEATDSLHSFSRESLSGTQV